MAATEEPPVASSATNGNGHADSDEEAAPRPVDIEQDMREMDRRKRVEAIMSSKLFRYFFKRSTRLYFVFQENREIVVMLCICCFGTCCFPGLFKKIMIS